MTTTEKKAKYKISKKEKVKWNLRWIILDDIEFISNLNLLSIAIKIAKDKKN
jgi:hypothetical protein